MTDWDEIQQHWEDCRKKILSNWNKLTPEQIDIIDGNQIALIADIQLTYACKAEEAERQVNDWQSNLLGTKSNNEPITQNLEEQLKQNQNTPETIEERDTVIGSPFHKGY